MKKKLVAWIVLFCIVIAQFCCPFYAAAVPTADDVAVYRYFTNLQIQEKNLIDKAVILEALGSSTSASLTYNGLDIQINTHTDDGYISGALTTTYEIAIRFLTNDYYYFRTSETVTESYLSDAAYDSSGIGEWLSLRDDMIFTPGDFVLHTSSVDEIKLELYVVNSFTLLANYDLTDVYDDLNNAQENFFENYSAFGTGDTSYISVVTVNEVYYDQEMLDNYALYFYLYNPSGKEIVYADISLLVQSDPEGDPMYFVPYYKPFHFKVCSSVSGRGEMDNCFVKVSSRYFGAGTFSNFVRGLDPDERKYSFNAITVYYADGEVKEYEISNTFRFAGQDVFGENAARSVTTKEVSCDQEQQKLYIDIGYTYYRTDTSPNGADYHNQVDSIYFNVPNSILNDYGKLTDVKLSYQRARTAPIIVTDDPDVYQALIQKKNLPELFSIESVMYRQNGVDVVYDFSFNTYLGIMNFSGGLFDSYSTKFNLPVSGLKYVFLVEDVDAGVNSSLNSVSSENLFDYLYQNYEKCNCDFHTGSLIGPPMAGEDYVLQGASGKICISNFAGYDPVTVINTSNLELSADGYASSHNFFEEWAEYGFFYALGAEDNESLDLRDVLVPIVDKNQLIDRGDELYYCDADEQDLQVCFDRSKLTDSTMYLCRFNVSQYYQNMLNTRFNGVTTGSEEAISYLAQEDLYLNLRVLEMSFESDSGLVTVLPVESVSVDVGGDITVEKDPEQIEDEYKDAFIADLKADFNWLDPIFKAVSLIFLFTLIVLLVIFVFPILKSWSKKISLAWQEKKKDFKNENQNKKIKQNSKIKRKDKK